MFKSFGVPYDEPEIPEGMEYLVSWLLKSGVCLPGFSGPTPLTWQEVEAFDSGACMCMTPWEKEQIIIMSRIYCSWLMKTDAKAPYESEETKKAKAERDRMISEKRERLAARKSKRG